MPTISRPRRPRRAARPGPRPWPPLAAAARSRRRPERHHQRQHRFRQGHAPPRLLPQRHPRPGHHRPPERDVRQRRSARTSTLKTSTFNSGTDETTALLAGALDAAFVGPNPAINAYQKIERPAHPHRLRHRLGRRLPRREAVDHERGRPQGQEDRDAVARQHPGRRAAHLAEARKGYTTDDRRRRRRHDRPAGQLRHAHRVPDRRDRRRLGARAVRDPAPAGRRQGPRRRGRPCGRRASSSRRSSWSPRSSSTRTPTSSRTCSRASTARSTSSTTDPAQARAARVGRASAAVTGKTLADLARRDVVQEHHVHARPDRVVARRPTPTHAKALGFIDSTDLKNIYDLTLLNKLLTAQGKAAITP